MWTYDKPRDDETAEIATNELYGRQSRLYKPEVMPSTTFAF